MIKIEDGQGKVKKINKAIVQPLDCPFCKTENWLATQMTEGKSNCYHCKEQFSWKVSKVSDDWKVF